MAIPVLRDGAARRPAAASRWRSPSGARPCSPSRWRGVARTCGLMPICKGSGGPGPAHGHESAAGQRRSLAVRARGRAWRVRRRGPDAPRTGRGHHPAPRRCRCRRPVVARTALLTVAAFTAAAGQELPDASIWARSLADPSGAQCGAAGVIRVLDPGTASPLSTVDAVPSAPAPVGYVEGAGFAPGESPVTRAQVGGSLIARDGRSAESTLGRMGTGWYRLPGVPSDGATVTVLARGCAERRQQLDREYGTLVGGRVTDLGGQQLTDTARDPAWRTMILRPPIGADVVRLTAVDRTTFIHGWLAFSAPEIQHPIALTSYIPRGVPVAVSWQIAFDYPCLRQPRAVDGITEPAAYAVAWGDRSLSGLYDCIWTPDRGGLFSGRSRAASPSSNSPRWTAPTPPSRCICWLAPRPRRLHRDHDDARPGRRSDGERDRATGPILISCLPRGSAKSREVPRRTAPPGSPGPLRTPNVVFAPARRGAKYHEGVRSRALAIRSPTLPTPWLPARRAHLSPVAVGDLRNRRSLGVAAPSPSASTGVLCAPHSPSALWPSRTPTSNASRKSSPWRTADALLCARDVLQWAPRFGASICDRSGGVRFGRPARAPSQEWLGAHSRLLWLDMDRGDPGRPGHYCQR